MKIPKLRWIIAAMLFFATAVNYADRQALAVVSDRIRVQFGMTEIDYSRILAGFFLAYAIMYAGSGYIVDRLGTKKSFSLFIGVWSLAAMLHAFARGVWSFGACRFLLGLGEPGNWPAATKAVSEWFAPKQRALGVGIFNAGSSVGSALAPPIVSWLTIVYGWQFAFIAVAAAGFAWLALWSILYDSPHRSRLLRHSEYVEFRDEVLPVEEAKPATARKVDWGRVVRTREAMALCIARTFTDPVIYFVIFWLPAYLVKERGFDQTMIGQYSWVPFVFGGIAYMLGGWMSGWLMSRGWSLPRARKRIMLAGAAFLPLAILAPFAPNAGLAIAAICSITIGHGFWTANLQTLPADLFPGQEVGTVAGFSGMGGAIGGMVANLGTGYVVSQFSYAPIFLIAGLMHPMCMAIIFRMLPDSRFRSHAPVAA
ncbi:MAG TPA: MFS transporter [Bryobacteraceae bacterium]|nr:MFS transporter [Bryobacteraceae bacterium]